jgi:hypothetical protein
MEKYIDTMRQVSDLSQTALEGLEYVKQMLNEGKIEAALSVSEDFTHAFYQMEKSYDLMMANNHTEDLRNQTIALRESINLLVSSFEVAHYSKAKEVIQFNLLPSYRKWQNLLQESFRPYIVS